MTDDPTQQYDVDPASVPAPADPVLAAPDPAPGAPDGTAATSEGFTPPPAAPVTPVATAGPSKARWFVAIGVAVVAIGAAVAGFLLVNGTSTPEALLYVPGDAAAVVEIRPDLPGDQLEQMGKLISHFPGFADLSTLDQKVDQALTKLFRNTGGTGVDYTTEIKPWLSGPLYIAVRKGDATTTSSMAPFGMLISLTTDGQVTCANAFKGQTTTTESYNGTDLVFVSGSEIGCATKDHQGLLGDRTSLKAAIDTKAAGNGIVTSATYKAATAALTGDHLATAFYDFQAYFGLLEDMMEDLPGSAANPFQLANVSLPAWAMMGIRAEGDAIVMDAKTPVPAQPSGGPSFLALPAAHPSGIAPLVPADAVAFIEGQGAGVGLENMITQLRTMPELDEQLKVLDGVVDLNTMLGWIQDAGVVVTGGDSPTTSIVLLAADEAAAAEKAGSIGAVIGLIGLQAPDAVSVHDSTVNGVKITTLTITDAEALLGGSGLDVPAGPVEISYAVKGRALIFGVGTSAIEQLVNVQAGAWLADDAAFKRVAARGVSPSAVTMYVAIPKVLELVESAMPADALTTWNSDVKPYLEPLEAIYFVTESEGDLAETTAILSVKPS
jgi:hypothetical protein